MPTSAPLQAIQADTGVISVRPADVYTAGQQFMLEAHGLDDDAVRLTQQLSGTGGMAGTDAGSVLFAQSYDPQAARTLQALVALRDSFAGVSTGLYTTANNYVQADWRSTPGTTAPPPLVSPPGAPATTFGPLPGASGTAQAVNNAVAGVSLSGLSGDALISFLKLIFPRGHQDQLHQAENTWGGLVTATDGLPNAVAGILAQLDVDQKSDHNGWRKAMDDFCTRIWGTTPWGQPNKPLLNVVTEAASQLQLACNHMAAAIDNTHSSLEHRLGADAAAAVIALVVGGATGGILDFLFGAVMEDTIRAAAQIVITEYYQPVTSICSSINLSDELDAAISDAPSFLAMEAQAISVGDRALHNFEFAGTKATTPNRKPVLPSTKLDDDPRKYPIDLAAQEGVDGAHVIDNHVGKTDGNLQRRLIDDPTRGQASTFPDLDTAQTLVQQAIDDNEQLIDGWINDPARHARDLRLREAISPDAGQSWKPGATAARPASILIVNLKYDPNLDPPFVVVTAYPTG